MVDVKNKRCMHEHCTKRPNFNLPTETKGLYCFEHKLENMISVKSKKCQEKKCKDLAMYGFSNKRAQYCASHQKPNMVNIQVENTCIIDGCTLEYDYIVDENKYCSTHVPNKSYNINLKRLCKYCDILEESKYVCKECRKIQNKKEWAIVRYLRKAIDTSFEYNTSKMLNGCSKRRPDIYFELQDKCIIVEVDENQHRSYEDSCECARLNEIVNGVGGLPVTFIRYNPDSVRNNGKIVVFSQEQRLDLLVNTLKEELCLEANAFQVRVIQLFYDDMYDTYLSKKEEDITYLVCV